MSAAGVLGGGRTGEVEELPELLTDPVAQYSDPTDAAGCGQERDDWILSFRTTDERMPLFCVCSGGGNVQGYRDFAVALPAGLPVHVFGVPRFLAAEGFPSVRRLAEVYIANVRRRQPHGPYRLCGHSFGGIVVYEMAARLLQAGEEVSLLALIDTVSPTFRQTLSRRERLRFRAVYLAGRALKYAKNLATGRIDRIGRDAAKYVSSRARRMLWNRARSAFRPLSQCKPVLRDEVLLFAAWNGFSPPPYAGPLLLLNAQDRPREYAFDPTLGWKHSARGTIEIDVVPGDHLSIMHPPHVEVLASRISAKLRVLESL
jgi:thioesterase domain-containing protein